MVYLNLRSQWQRVYLYFTTLIDREGGVPPTVIRICTVQARGRRRRRRVIDGRMDS